VIRARGLIVTGARKDSWSREAGPVHQPWLGPLPSCHKGGFSPWQRSPAAGKEETRSWRRRYRGS